MRILTIPIVIALSYSLSGCHHHSSTKNHSPIAQNTSLTLQEDDSISGSFGASDEDNDTLTVQVISEAQLGHIYQSQSEPLRFNYVPNANANGADIVTFIVSDGKEHSSQATVEFHIQPVNDLPTSEAQWLTTREDEPLTAIIPMNDVDGDAVSLVVDSDARITGSFTVLDPLHGIIRFDPTQDRNGNEDFYFSVTDGSASSTYAIHMEVTPVNDAPVAHDDVIKTTLGVPVTQSVAVNDTDVDVEGVSIQSVSSTTAGQVIIDGTSNIRFSPNPDFLGTATISYAIADAAGAISTAQIRLEVTLPRTLYFLADLDTPQIQELYQYDGIQTLKLSLPLRTGEEIVDFKVTHLGLMYKTRYNSGSYLYFKDVVPPLSDLPAIRVSTPANIDTYGAAERTRYYISGNSLYLIEVSDPPRPNLLPSILMFQPSLPGEQVTQVLQSRTGSNQIAISTTQYSPALGVSTVRFLRQSPPFSRDPPILTTNGPDYIGGPLFQMQSPQQLGPIIVGAEIGGIRALYKLAATPIRISPQFGLNEFFSSLISGPDATSLVYAGNPGSSSLNIFRSDTNQPGVYVQLNARSNAAQELGDFSMDAEWTNLYYILSDASLLNRRIYRTNMATPGVGAPITTPGSGTYGAYGMAVGKLNGQLLYVDASANTGPSQLLLISNPQLSSNPKVLMTSWTVMTNP